MFLKRAVFIVVGCLLGASLSSANAATCSWTILTNGTPADANQVMNDLACLAPISGAVFTSPSNVSGTTSASSPPAPGIVIQSADGGAMVAGQDVNHSITLRRGIDGATDVLDFHEFGTIRFFTGGLLQYQPLRMTINNNGAVGIGTPSPYALLTVGGGDIDAYSAGPTSPAYPVGASLYLADANFNNSSYFNSAPGISAVYGALGDSSDLAFYVFTGSPNSRTERMRILSNGNVGIGTGTPTRPLSVETTNSGASSLLTLNVPNALGNTSAIDFAVNAGGGTLVPVGRISTTYAVGNQSGLAFSVFNGSLSEAFYIGSSGNVGFGNSYPVAKVSFPDLTGSSSGDGMTWYSGAPFVYGIYKTAGTWTAPDYQQLKISFNTGVIIDGGSAYGKSGTVIQPGGGNVGIGTSAPGQKLDVAGTIRQLGCTVAGTLSTNTSGDIICTSDARLKNILGPYHSGLDALAHVTPQRFTYKTTKNDPVEVFVHAGFIAQDVMAAIPEASAKQRSGYYSLDTTAILAVSVNAIKELKSANDRQAAVIAHQAAEIAHQTFELAYLRKSQEAAIRSLQRSVDALEKSRERSAQIDVHFKEPMKTYGP